MDSLDYLLTNIANIKNIFKCGNYFLLVEKFILLQLTKIDILIYNAILLLKYSDVSLSVKYT